MQLVMPAQTTQGECHHRFDVVKNLTGQAKPNLRRLDIVLSIRCANPDRLSISTLSCAQIYSYTLAPTSALHRLYTFFSMNDKSAITIPHQLQNRLKVLFNTITG